MERDLLKRATGLRRCWSRDSDPLQVGGSPEGRGIPDHAGMQDAEVSRQAFFDWRAKRAAGPTGAEVAEAELVVPMQEIHAEADGTYGQPRMTPELRARGFCVNHKRTERLMRAHGIVGVRKPAKVRTTIPAEDNPRCPI